MDDIVVDAEEKAGGFIMLDADDDSVEVTALPLDDAEEEEEEEVRLCGLAVRVTVARTTEPGTKDGACMDTVAVTSKGADDVGSGDMAANAGMTRTTPELGQCDDGRSTEASLVRMQERLPDR